MPIAKVNPHQARRFAEATGNLAKTDALDAAKPSIFKPSGHASRLGKCDQQKARQAWP
jgi:hypothetical protein